MDDFIWRAEACDEIGKMIHEYREKGDHDLADALILSRRYVLKRLPAVDAALVTHGRWTHYLCVGHDMYQCSECSHWINAGIDRNYCPNCGAKMINEE